MKKEGHGFILVVNSISEAKNWFVENEIPKEGDVLELVVVKSNIEGESYMLDLKLQTAQK
ncbi:hypothetical protein [Escherichia coli]|uniref:hypothetical protein n=1 Tax=Escherichia coli TaxID=562 RepID=UPI00005EEA55|nr:hypothetical protein [Escherichia coli]AIF64489.1 hypothetical protein L960_4666 [Escherichia coli B7A]